MIQAILFGMAGPARDGTGMGAGPGAGWFGMGQFMGFPGGGLLVLLLVAMAVYIMVRLVRPGGRGPDREPPLDTLKRRYAAGEIDQETFERMKRELE